MPVLQRLEQRGFIDQTATGAIDDADAALCFLQSRFIENVASLCGQRCMQRNEIRARKQIVELIHQLDLQAAGARC